MRAVISFLPLVIAAALAGLVLWKRPGQTAWQEGVGTYWVLAIGATISLVPQTYHLSGEFAEVMLTRLVAGLPVVYLLNASTSAMLYWLGVTVWAGNVAARAGCAVVWGVGGGGGRGDGAGGAVDRAVF